jgi:hypothetical protein
MIEQGLFFAAGACAAALLWVLLLPAFWRRAMRLSRARLAFSLPLSLEEVLAEQDRLRAAHAVALAQAEQAAARHTLAAAEAKAQASASRQDYLALELRCADFKAMADRLEAENAQLAQVIAAQQDGIANLVGMLATLHVPPPPPAPTVPVRQEAEGPADAAQPSPARDEHIGVVPRARKGKVRLL